MIRTNKYFPIPLTFKYKFSIMTFVSNFAEVSPNGRAAAWKAVGG